MLQKPWEGGGYGIDELWVENNNNEKAKHPPHFQVQEYVRYDRKWKGSHTEGNTSPYNAAAKNPYSSTEVYIQPIIKSNPKQDYSAAVWWVKLL